MSFIERLEKTLSPATQQVPTQPATTTEVQTTLSQLRVELWLALIPKVQALYTHLDNVTADAELVNGHILEDDIAVKQLLHLLHDIYLLVRDDKYLTFTLFGVTSIKEEDLGAVYYRFGKNSLKPILYVILRFEKECQLLTYLLQTTEKVALDYVFQRLDDELFNEYIAGCKKSQNILLGLFDFNKHIKQTNEQVHTLSDWLSDMNFFQLYESDIRNKLDVLFEKTLVHTKVLTSPSLSLLRVINAEN